jgi:LmbE family N-acetylglucosaminyl deacetylase
VILRKILVLGLALLLAVGALAQNPAGAGLQEKLRGLGTTLRVLQITAHPGDEDGALLLYFSHSLGAEVTLLTLTRGERGDSRLGIVEPTEQGLLRTTEQLASDSQYGAEQRFTRVVDFGFARTANEVFDRWLGHNVALADMVRVIRETRPEIIVTPFDVSTPDGDGQHEATAILVGEAFRAAADSKKFPEQLKDGVEPWQAKRLFALARSGAYSVAFDAGTGNAGASAAGGESLQAQAQRALDEQRSQIGIWHAPRDAMRHYRLIDSAPGFAMPVGAKDFAEGLDSRLESLSSVEGLSAEGHGSRR